MTFFSAAAIVLQSVRARKDGLLMKLLLILSIAAFAIQSAAVKIWCPICRTDLWSDGLKTTRFNCCHTFVADNVINITCHRVVSDIDTCREYSNSLERSDLLISVHKVDIDLIESSLRKGAAFENPRQYPPLFDIVMHGDLELAYDRFGGYHAWFLCAYYGKLKIMKLLLNRTNINERDITYEQTALHFSAYLGQLEIAMLLLNRRVDIDARDVCGKTALHISAYHGHLKLTKLLLDCGADINALDRYGKSALHVSMDQGHSKIEEILRSHVPDACSICLEKITIGCCVLSCSHVFH